MLLMRGIAAMQPEPYEVIKYSMGKYGCNGLVIWGRSGRLYAVTARTMATQIFF